MRMSVFSFVIRSHWYIYTGMTLKNPFAHLEIDDPVAPARASEVVHALFDKAGPDDKIGIGEVVEALGRRAFGLGILLFSLPNSLPIPSIPGFSTLTGLPILFFAFQLTMGRSQCWLPHWLAVRQLPIGKIAPAMKKVIPYIDRAEKYLQPRLLQCSSPFGLRLAGAVILFLATILALPIPFGNFLPGFCVSIIALGILQRDGVVILSGAIGGILSSYIVFLLFRAFAATLYLLIFG